MDDFGKMLAAHDREVAVKALEDFAKGVRAAWAPHTCPWVGAIDDRAAAIRRGEEK